MNPDSKYNLPYRAFTARSLETPTQKLFRPTKLTAQQRLEIAYRRQEGERAVDLALEYKVSRGLIDECGKMWRP